MAIVDMKKLTVMAMASDRDKVLRALQRLRCVEVIPQTDEAMRARVHTDTRRADEADEVIGRIAWAIKELSRYQAAKGGMLAGFAPKPALDAAQSADILARGEALLNVVREAEACERKAGDLRSREARIQASQEQFAPWLTLDVPLERLGSTRTAESWLAAMPLKHLENLRAAIAERGIPAELAKVSDEREVAYVLAVCHRTAKEETETLLREHEATPVNFAGQAGTVRQCMDALTAQRKEIAAEWQTLEAQRTELSADLGELKAYHDLLEAERSRLRAAEHFVGTEQTFLLQAWTPASQVAAVEAKLHAASPTCAVETEDPAEDEKPPTYLHNGRAAQPFEALIENFSMPDPRGVDPTAIWRRSLPASLA